MNFVRRASARLFYCKESNMAWIGWAIVIAQIGALAGYRYAYGKWPLKLDF